MQVRIATFNMASGEDPDCTAVERLFVDEDLDVIGLQEIERFTARAPYDMLPIVAGRNYQWQFAPTLALMGGQYGIATFARHQISQVKIHKYGVTGEEDRVFINVVIRLGDDTLSFYNTHLSFETPAIRSAQVAELMQAVHDDKHRNKVVVGDFNMDQSLSEWEAFDSSYTRVNGNSGHWFDTYKWRDSAMKVNAIDNIILSPGINLVEAHVVRRILSDHQMLVATISLPDM
ncbi:endonuclease/exonuclease/phosphatase family protein [Lacticaseibacillus yichunensis]|uniref:Endonuclease/exonuclease/phosphatase family protein n=1 Tax=Lacticaseibacillus yichunensis TaxID=2486015 RepID=A0ABW4CQ22_9LACO|nr:endonuclease/exonuclease/phosphatase family protein [Lacticaseibacillus yichunensis]